MQQRGAMFGLDARIALAIFAGLSVVAGTAVFGALSETESTALVTEKNNIAKGYINYVFDTGLHPGAGNFDALINDPGGVPRWAGPYITLNNNQHLKYGEYQLVNGGLGSGPNNVPAACGSAPAPCWAWLELTDVPTPVLIQVDIKMDGTGVQSPSTGTFRIGGATSTTGYYRLQRNR